MRKRVLTFAVLSAASSLALAVTAQGAGAVTTTQTFSCPLSGSTPCTSLSGAIGGTSVTPTSDGYQFAPDPADQPGYVSIGDSNKIPMTKFPITVTVDVKNVGVPSSLVGDYDVVRGSKAANWKIEVVARNKRTTARASCYFKGTAGKGAATGGPNLVTATANTWQTITCTDTGSAITLAVDGTTVSKSVSTGSIPNTGTALIGAKDLSGGDQFTGWARNMTVTVPAA